MGFLDNVLGRAKEALTQLQGDKVFLNAAASACANITAADGVIEDIEIDAAVDGMMENKVLKGIFSPAEIQSSVQEALRRAKTRAGKLENKRFIEALSVRPVTQRQDVFLIAADVADDGGIGDAERKVLDEIAKELRVDARELLG